MVHIRLEDILSESDAAARISKIFAEVETQGRTIVVTKDGRPAVAITPVNNLESEVVTDEDGVDSGAVSEVANTNTSTIDTTTVVSPVIEPVATSQVASAEPVVNASTVDTTAVADGELPPLPDMPS